LSSIISSSLSLIDSLICCLFYNDRFTKEVDLDAPWRKAFELEFKQDSSLGEVKPASNLDCDYGDGLDGLNSVAYMVVGFFEVEGT
jgi:hypothetical protein